MRKSCPRFLPFFIFFLLLICTTNSVNAQLKKYVFEAEKMGSPLRIIMMCDDSAKAAKLAKQAYALTDSINAIISDYDTSSELSRLNSSSGSAEPITVSPLLLRLMWHAGMANHHSRGAFDA
ncbi:MAG: FAD:protein FMN transferase, partial [Sediminibacterium sp.]